MGKKRKRPNKQSATTPPPEKRNVTPTHSHDPVHSQVHHPIISWYYPQVLTLRQYLLHQLPVSSKVRHRRIASLGAVTAVTANKVADHRPAHVPETDLVRLLDTTLVGVLHHSGPTVCRERRRDLAAFTQSQSESQGGICSQSEIVEYVIATLFSRCTSYQRPQHLLAQGFQRINGSRAPNSEREAKCNIPGFIARFPNKNVQTLQQVPWTEVLDLLGSNGEEIMLRLLLDCGVFPCIDQQRGVYYQLSGLPLLNLEPLNQKAEQNEPDPAQQQRSQVKTSENASVKPNSIIFIRRRALYSRPALNAKGGVRVGLRHDHVLNRFPCADSLAQTVHLMKSIFPKQFGLPNVFTSANEQVLPFQDFPRDGSEEQDVPKIPKRLRGKPVELAQQLQKRNGNCSYAELLRYYCPSESTGPWKLSLSQSNEDPKSSASQPLITQPNISVNGPQLPEMAHPTYDGQLDTTIPPPKVTLTDYATPASSVSAFCRAVLRKLIPPRFFGISQEGHSNQRVVFKQVDRFIRMRRFESLNLHEVCQGLKITCIPWLEHPNASTSHESTRPRLSLTDLQKRTELLYEFIYFLFNSILIPLIRTNFYVTESQAHRNRLFFFRQDVWRQLTEQPLADLKSRVFEELKPETARRVLSRRSLGYSSLRLLPKTTGIRPITNLGRRVWMKCKWPGKKGYYLGPSINSTITPIYNMLNYERARGPRAFGSSLRSVGDMLPRLRSFKEHLQQQAGTVPPLYFVKLDIQSCFDTIPQQKLIRLIEELISEESYHVTKQVELRPSEDFSDLWPQQATRPNRIQRKFAGRAAPATKPQSLPDAFASGVTSHRRNTVFVDPLTQREYNSEDLLDLLDEHVRNNLVRIGKKYFRQRNGIPQGSVLSSILCNYFYAELERQVLGFLPPDQALLLRLVDDFLLVTCNIDLAVRFLQVMIRGQPAYGISVHPAKSLVNFAAAVDGIQIPRLEGSRHFPYCGNLIDTHTLEIYRDQDRALEGGDTAAETLSNALTVESARAPGRSLHRKVLASFKLLMHPMYLDTTHNSRQAVLSNLYANFVTSAMKMYRYLKSLQSRAHPPSPVLIRTIQDLTQLAQKLSRSRQDASSDSSAPAAPVCDIPHSQVQHLAACAFRFVLGRKQTRYGAVLRWLDGVCKTTRPKSDGVAVRIAQVVRTGNMAFGEWRF